MMIKKILLGEAKTVATIWSFTKTKFCFQAQVEYQSGTLTSKPLKRLGALMMRGILTHFMICKL